MVGREVGLPGYARCRISGTPVYGCQGNTGVHRIDKGILSRVSIREAWIRATPPRRRRVQPLNELKHLGNWIPGRRGNAGCRFADWLSLLALSVRKLRPFRLSSNTTKLIDKIFSPPPPLLFFFLSFESNLTVVKIICIGRFWRMKVPHLKATREYEESQISRRLFMVALETYASTNPFRESGNRDNCHRIFVTIQGRTRVVKDNTRVLNFTTRRTGDRLSGYLLKKMVEDGRYTMGDNF